MKKQLLFVLFLLFSFLNVVNATERDSIVTKNLSIPPVNDECSGAINIPVNPTLEVVSFVSGTTLDATTTTVSGSYCENVVGNEVWYTFTATAKRHIIDVDITSGTASLIRYSINAGTCDNLYAWHCENQEVVSSLTIGATYFVSVSAYSETPETPVYATFDISISTPPLPINDECENAVPIPVNEGLVADLFAEGESLGATLSPEWTVCGDDVWFSFTATSAAHILNFFDLDESIQNVFYTLYKAEGCVLLNSSSGCSSESQITALTAGQTYKIRVFVYNDFESDYDLSSFKVSITTPPPPVNDYCSNALEIPVNDSLDCNLFVSGSTLAATESPLDAVFCSDIPRFDIWYTFTATSKVHIIHFLNQQGFGDSSNFIYYDLYLGDECQGLQQIKCNTSTSVQTFNNLVIGSSYKIRVYTGHISTYFRVATFDLCITTPPPAINDDCNTATNINVSPSVVSYTTTPGTLLYANGSPQSTTCPGNADDDVWFEFAATSTRHLINIENIIGGGNAFNINHALYAGIDCDNLELISCSDPNNSLATNLIIGQTYKIRVWSFGSIPVAVNFDISVSHVFESIVANTTQFTNEQLVTNVLVNNPCVDISNITSSTGTNFGSVNGIGYFTNTNPFFPITSGVVLSTGNAVNVGGPNLTSLGDGTNTWLGDADLSAIQAAQIPPISGNLYNATKLEFDFTSQNEFMSFNFLFASEEYGTFQCSYADAFAFLLTDLTTGITTNLAVVPGTASPVSVVTIRNSENNPSCSSENEGFFDTYFDGLLAQTAATNFNGQTELMSASSAIIPNNPYHIKLVIADRQDSVYDSAVFIQAGSFSSGPPQCTDKVQLVAFIDANNNGTKEDTESSFTYGSFVYQLNNAGDINNISSPIGNYTIYDENPLNSYDFSYEVHPEYATYFSAGTINHNDISIAVGSGTQTLYFPITQIQGYNDVTVSIVPVGQPTAGFSYTNKIVYTNLGTAATSGTITYTKDTAVTISSDQPGVVATTDGFTFAFADLAPYETRSFNISINVPSIPVVNIDDVLESSVAISAPSDDINLNNNTYVNSQIVVASYDPNDKMEAHGEKLDINNFSQDDYLFYTIRFQNTGTANAINIRIEDVLDAQLDEESIRMISASHNYVMERVGNELVWKFDYIYLPSILENEVLSNGYLTFKIKVKPGFEVGDMIPNFAEIYFDTNPAIITNTFTSTFEEQLATPEFSSGNLLIYPNPSNGMVYINTQNTTENLKEINLYDVLGKIILSTKNLSSKQSTLNVGSLAKGVYMVEITTENNFKQTKKLVVN